MELQKRVFAHEMTSSLIVVSKFCQVGSSSFLYSDMCIEEINMDTAQHAYCILETFYISNELYLTFRMDLRFLRFSTMNASILKHFCCQTQMVSCTETACGFQSYPSSYILPILKMGQILVLLGLGFTKLIVKIYLTVK